MSSTVLITGANRGIGLELAKLYKEMDYSVLAVCRSASDELRSLGVQMIEGIDLADDNAVSTLATELQGKKINLLINNAGILERETLDNFNIATIRSQWEINALAPLKLTVALQQCLTTPGKVVFITSRMGSIEDNTSGARYGYRMSKAALNAAGKSLSIDLKTRGIAVAILHPGWVKTDMTDHTGNIEAHQAAKQLVQRIDVLNLDNTGTFWHASGEVLPW